MYNLRSNPNELISGLVELRISKKERPKMATFILNPYDVPLVLSDKEDRELFTETSKGLKEKDMFNGKRENYGNFVKLIEKDFENTRIMESLEIAVFWNYCQSCSREPTKIINVFNSNEVTQELLTHHCNLV